MTKGSGSGKTPPRVIELLKAAVTKSSQSAISRESGVGVAAINRYLKGNGDPTNATLQKFSVYFDKSVSWLQGYDNSIELEISGESVFVDWNTVKLTGVEFILLFGNDISQQEFDGALTAIIARVLRDLSIRNDVTERDKVLKAFIDFKPDMGIFKP